MKALSFFLLFIGLLSGRVAYSQPASQDLPNILWLTSEDNSPFLGCYGDKFATTPNLDKLASQGFLYTRAYSNAPVCAPSRNTIITGVYGNSGGNENMRSNYRKSDIVRAYPEFLRALGYYCTNNSKEDYNIELSQAKGVWDESSGSAHYKNRRPGQPFFAIFNTTLTHESSIHTPKPAEKLRHDPEKVPIPPYHPRTKEMKHDWAYYYDNVENMDAWVGEKLKELEEAGLADNTIVFYYADHGGILGRSKRYIYESGTHVPFIVRIPEKYRHLFPNQATGTKVDRMISFVDLAPTLLSIAGAPVPEFMQGKAFLGDQKTVDPEYVYMFRGRMDERFDLSRAVRDKKFRYIRNYMPHRIYGQHIDYLWKAPSLGSWEKACLEGKCNDAQMAFWKPKPAEELYDTENDPWEVHNLANDPRYADVLNRMRKAQRDWVLEVKDAGFFPEPDRELRMGNAAAYDYLRQNKAVLKAVVEAAEVASLGKKENVKKLTGYLRHKDPAIRYWGATGLLILGQEAAYAANSLKAALNDGFPSVRIVVAEALHHLGEREIAEKALLEEVLKGGFVSTFAINALDAIDINSAAAKAVVQQVLDKNENNYNTRAARWLLDKPE